jgi:hypothetical protein
MILTARLNASVLLTTITTPMAMAVKALRGPLNLFLYPKVIILFSLMVYSIRMQKPDSISRVFHNLQK